MSESPWWDHHPSSAPTIPEAPDIDTEPGKSDTRQFWEAALLCVGILIGTPLVAYLISLLLR